MQTPAGGDNASPPSTTRVPRNAVATAQRLIDALVHGGRSEMYTALYSVHPGALRDVITVVDACARGASDGEVQTLAAIANALLAQLSCTRVDVVETSRGADRASDAVRRATRAGVPEPAVLVLESPYPDAISVCANEELGSDPRNGLRWVRHERPDGLTIVMTTGMLDVLSDDELTIAARHEIGHWAIQRSAVGRQLFRALRTLKETPITPDENPMDFEYSYGALLRRIELEADTYSVRTAADADHLQSMLAKLQDQWQPRLFPQLHARGVRFRGGWWEEDNPSHPPADERVRFVRASLGLDGARSSMPSGEV